MDATALRLISIGDISAAVQATGSTAPRVTPRYTVQTYRLTYRTVDAQGATLTASALVAVPQKPNSSLSPVLAFQHGTITRDAEAPSNAADPGSTPVALAALGYIVLAADYVGYGSSKGTPHPYLLATPTAAAVNDLLTAARYWRQTVGLRDNQQLFLAGYSEGGYASLAAQRALQAGNSPLRAQVVRVVPGGGPYNVGTTLDAQLQVVRQVNPLLGALISPGLLRLLSEGDRTNVRNALLEQLLGSGTDVSFAPNTIDAFLADDRAGIEGRSNVVGWLPEVPIHFFHGRNDTTVAYKVAVETVADMQTRGAGTRVSLTDCAAVPSGHLDCVPGYWQFLISELGAVARDL